MTWDTSSWKTTNGLIVDVEITHASGTSEQQAARAMLECRADKHKRATLRADKGYDRQAFVEGCRRPNDKCSAMDGCTTGVCG